MIRVKSNLASMLPDMRFTKEVEQGTSERNETDGYSLYKTQRGLLVAVSDNEKENLPTVVVLATGGTIAGAGAAGKATNYTAGRLDIGTLVDSITGVTNIANIRGIQICNVGSDDITDKEWLTIANVIEVWKLNYQVS